MYKTKNSKALIAFESAKSRVQNRFFNSRIRPLVLASSRHPATFRTFIPISPVKFSKGYFLFQSRIPLSISKLSHIPSIEIRASRSRQAIFIPYPGLNISGIPHPASILSPIPHPAKPMLDPQSVLAACNMNINWNTKFSTTALLTVESLLTGASDKFQWILRS